MPKFIIFVDEDPKNIKPVITIKKGDGGPPAVEPDGPRKDQAKEKAKHPELREDIVSVTVNPVCVLHNGIWY